ncbi:glyoxalase/bleomycin resistance/dioxygenase family protein [Paenibacillus albiflavus]|uniref:Glyoxalase/bleomycin resistance/dioxygenase family protein n=1 Tax=Paenibacillus albiflavus TaxID=2545760 RepID=A0A4V2WMH2_9BACL|nr:VOC family protein [Paenibacillus albiflavus]TCZ69294.1 glyoxalase/bleomycin resistance/dioxygenase family protein [Paenibacillus albiflavus]
MKIKESGIVVFMENYESTVEFYISVLSLPVRERKVGLTILEFGNSYLMIEDKGVASHIEKTRAQNPTVLRIDVEDFEQTISEMTTRGADIKVHKFNWGTIGVIIDPEGNRIEIKETIL